MGFVFLNNLLNLNNENNKVDKGKLSERAGRKVMGLK